MDNKDHIVLSCDTLGTPVSEAWQNLQMSSPILTKDNIERVDKKVSHYNCEDSSEHIQSSKYVNCYDNESYVEQLKTEFPEDVFPQSDCPMDSKMHSDSKELLKFVAKAEIKDENTEDGLSLNIKEENDYSEYQFIVKTEGLEEQEDIQCEFYHKTLKNGCNLLQNSNKHVKIEINTPVDNGINELHQCKYCGNGFDNYNNMLVHISIDHKREKSKCEICGKQFKSVGNLNRHILAFHKLDKPLEPITENCVNYHVNVQHKWPVNDHSKLSCSGKEDGEDESENKVTRNITNYDYGTTIECRCGKQHRSPIHLSDHQKVMHRLKIPKTNNERFQCEFCKKSFKAKSSLVEHIKGTHIDYGRKFNCSCGKQFRSPMLLRKHERLIHKRNVRNTNDGKFQCDYCKAFLINKRNLILHIRRVHYDYGKRFVCWCGKQFRSPIHLQEHERHIHRHNVHNTNNDKFQCDSCKKPFKAKSSLARHIKSVHVDYGRKFICWCGKEFRSPMYLRQHERLIHKHNIQNTNDGKFQCDYCKAFLISKRNLILHIKRVHYDYGKCFDCWCGKQFRSPIHLQEHKRHIHRHNVHNTNNDKFQCDSCKKSFKTKASLVIHIKCVHFDYGKKFICWCRKEFRSPIHLRQHERLIHKHNIQNTNDGKFQCDYCKAFLISKRNLILHIKRVHYDYGKCFDCWCGKQFRSPIHLQEHKRHIHRHNVHNTNNDKFQCDSCKKSFKIKASLARHIKNVHFDYGTKFICWCGKQFRSPLHLRKHQRVEHNVQNIENTKFQCDYCKVFLINKRNLMLHTMRVHYDYGKRFDCWCGKRFRSPIHLQEHERHMHRQKVKNTKNDKVQCDSCKKSFNTTKSLARHIKTVHFDYGREFECWCGKQFRSPINLQQHERRSHKHNVQNTDSNTKSN